MKMSDPIKVWKIGAVFRDKSDLTTQIEMYQSLHFKDLRYYRDFDISSKTYGNWYAQNPIYKNENPIPDSRFHVIRREDALII